MSNVTDSHGVTGSNRSNDGYLFSIFICFFSSLDENRWGRTKKKYVKIPDDAHKFSFVFCFSVMIFFLFLVFITHSHITLMILIFKVPVPQYSV